MDCPHGYLWMRLSQSFLFHLSSDRIQNHMENLRHQNRHVNGHFSRTKYLNI